MIGPRLHDRGVAPTGELDAVQVVVEVRFGELANRVAEVVSDALSDLHGAVHCLPAFLSVGQLLRIIRARTRTSRIELRADGPEDTDCG